jgi:hypothetical protein
MKIIKKEGDFYDSVLSYGVDNSIVYKRTVEENLVIQHGWTSETILSSHIKHRHNEDFLNLPESMRDILSKIHETSLGRTFTVKDKSKQVELRESYVIFCGEVIPVIIITGSMSIHPNATDFQKNDYCHDKFSEGVFDFNELINALSVFFGTDFIAKYMNKPVRYENTSRSKDFEQFFTGCENLSAEKVHHDIDCPVILLHSKGYIKNPILKSIRFARKYDPFTTYQKLEQFISGVLGGQSPKLVEIADIHRLEGRGFDKKISFRKRKESK